MLTEVGAVQLTVMLVVRASTFCRAATDSGSDSMSVEDGKIVFGSGERKRRRKKRIREQRILENEYKSMLIYMKIDF